MVSLTNWPSWLSRTSLQLRLALLLALAFSLLFGVFALVSLRILDDSTQHILQQREVISIMAARRYDELLTRAFDELDIATTFANFDPTDGQYEDEIQQLRYAFSRMHGFALGLQFLDTRGRVVAAEPDLALAGTDESALPFVAEALRTGQRSISQPFRDWRTGKPAIALTIPVRDAGGHVLSLLSGWINLDGMSLMGPIQQANSLGLTDLAELVDEHATVLVSTEDGVPPLTASDHASFYLRARAAGQPAVENIRDEIGPQAGESHVMAFAPLEVAPWSVGVGGSEAATFADVHELERDIWLTGLLSFVAVFALTLWGARMLIHPVKALTGAVQRIETGDLSSPIPVSAGGEIGVLQESFEAMRRRLQVSISEVNAARTSLEKRVRERTRELETLNAELQRSERVIDAQEEERKRLAREMHDDFAQSLTAASVTLESLTQTVPPGDEFVHRQLRSMQALITGALAQTSQWIRDLRPPMLDDMGMVPAIRSYAEARLEAAETAVSVESAGLDRRLPPQMELTLFRVAQEAVSNIARHARARHAVIRFDRYDGGLVVMHIEDDGQGFIPAPFLHAGEGLRGMGLIGMRERIVLLGGTLSIDSTPRRGTRIRAEVPWAGQAA
jgi:signal transduction histidine kinase